MRLCIVFTGVQNRRLRRGAKKLRVRLKGAWEFSEAAKNLVAVLQTTLDAFSLIEFLCC